MTMTNDKPKSDTPMVFVTGASRSGTTMLSRILGNHSKIRGLKELHCFGELVDANKLQELISKPDAIRLSQRLIARSKRDIWGTLEKEDCIEADALWRGVDDSALQTGLVVELTMSHLATIQDKLIPCEQTPRNIFYAQNLLEYFPNLRIVHIVRDPRDVLASQKNRWKRRKLGGNNIPYSEVVRVWLNYHPYTITKMWSKATQLARRLKAHERFYIVRFEDIVSDPAFEIQKICSFLQISYEEKMLDIPHVGSSHETNTDIMTGVRPIAHNRWKSSLSKGEVYICERTSSNEMQAFEYSKSQSCKPLSFSLIKQFLIYPIHVIGVLASNPRRAWIQLMAVLVKPK